MHGCPPLLWVGLDALVSEDLMKTLKLVIELTYDEDAVHGNEQESIDWFENDILLQKAG